MSVTKPFRPLRICSWNIRKAVGLDWRRNPSRILAVLDEIAADIVVLQEADRRLTPRHPALPAEVLDASAWRAVETGRTGPSLGHHGNAILTGADWNVSEVRCLDLPGLEPRGALAVWLHGPAGDLPVMATHLGLRRRDRLVQAEVIGAELHGFGPRALLAGDTNEWRAPGLPLPRGWSWTDPQRTFHTARPTLALDRIAAGPGWRITSQHVHRSRLAARASDHLPLVVALDGVS